MVSSPSVNVLDSTFNQISVGASFCVSPSVTEATPICLSFGTSTSHSLVASNMAAFCIEVKN